ncbi:hypothetical protein RRG08_026647 [Elysia crispata]|uniref:Uncharacterized protein n=1 Tax=Elysia crispata TaxID=231223 RepID=A0AAE1B029_9GAST|nr:hypothetical protein RRG08_026647 [Elysia crispata]
MEAIVKPRETSAYSKVKVELGDLTEESRSLVRIMKFVHSLANTIPSSLVRFSSVHAVLRMTVSDPKSNATRHFM